MQQNNTHIVDTKYFLSSDKVIYIRKGGKSSYVDNKIHSESFTQYMVSKLTALEQNVVQRKGINV